MKELKDKYPRLYRSLSMFNEDTVYLLLTKVDGENSIDASSLIGSFTWDNSKDGFDFWADIYYNNKLPICIFDME